MSTTKATTKKAVAKKATAKTSGKITLSINGSSVVVPEGTTILESAKMAGYHIPTLCYLKDVNWDNSCRICMVEVKGARNLVASCGAVAYEGMEVFTNTPKVLASRKTTLELILSMHERKCLSCSRNLNCELQTLANEYNCNEDMYLGERHNFDIDNKGGLIVRDNNKCILCRRCTSMCSNVQSVGVISAQKRGPDTHIASPFGKSIKETPCVLCGQCITVCPTAALTTTSASDKVLSYIADKELITVVATAPAVRIALGESFGLPIGENVEGKMIASLRRIGFNQIFDVTFSADLTIMEEAAEFVHRVSGDGKLPLLTSCSPGWVKFIETQYPELLPHVSSCKSPQQMFGAIIKTYYAKKMNIDVAKLRVVMIMPCIAKKYEANRDAMLGLNTASGYPDVDAVLTTAELAKLIQEKGIDFNGLKDEKFDEPFAGSTAGLIFGASGGVLEAALRTVSETVTKKPLEKLDFTAVRGVEGIKSASVELDGKIYKVASVSGLANARKILDDIKAGVNPYHFIEIMACPGGCVNGGGQPIKPANIRNAVDIRAVRASGLYSKDKKATVRKAHENPVIKVLYSSFLGEPGGKLAHDILHTKYKPKDKY
ncbi:MAG: NADH-dependent [FeFe] hydrogenase, group A6 [Firmicutes bacterium]|nr:NADH-dependent [FeFe] hydrogenase, group A6 [Bacillota bacterium]